MFSHFILQHGLLPGDLVAFLAQSYHYFNIYHMVAFNNTQ